MMQFHETVAGQRFLQGTLPKLTRAIEDLAERLSGKKSYEERRYELVKALVTGDTTLNNMAIDSQINTAEAILERLGYKKEDK